MEFVFHKKICGAIRINRADGEWDVYVLYRKEKVGARSSRPLILDGETPSLQDHMSFDENYFSSHTYENITFAKYSMYWWSNRFYATLARRYGKRGSRFLEVGSGMGHLTGQLEDTFETFGCDINHWAVKKSKDVVNTSQLQNASAQELPFRNGSI